MTEKKIAESRGVVTGELIEEAFRLHYRELFSYAIYIVSDSDLAKDLLQEAFLYAYENRSTIKSKETLVYYIRRVIHSKAINLVKRNRLLDRHHKNIIQDSEIISSYNSTYSYLTVKEIEKVLQDVINELPKQSRKVFELSRVKGLRHDEIAEELSISYKTVEVHIYRSLKILKEKLREFRAGDQDN